MDARHKAGHDKNIVLFLPEILLQPRSRTLMFLPLAHVLARAVQVICLSAGTTVGHTASAKELLEDLASFKPTFLLVVPRIFEKVYAGAAQKAALPARSGSSPRPRRPPSTTPRPSTPPPGATARAPGSSSGPARASSTGCCTPGSGRPSAASCATRSPAPAR